MKSKFLTVLTALVLFSTAQARTVIAIDAGHGGKDPGAIGKHLGLKEKEVTLSIARELKALLDADPNFKAVMTRNGDYFIQLPHRTEIARRNKANYLVSIHADSSPSTKDLKGASVWVLSNRRANDELGKWMEDHEKQSALLGGAGSVLSNTNERYLSQTVLDLQFSHSQRAGYELGKTVLRKISSVASLAKSAPQHASLSVLRSPDIPSILVETGFLSNASEEQKLSNIGYRRQIAQAIYNGLVEYRKRYAGYVTPKTVYKEAKNERKNELKKEEKSTKKDEKTKEIKTVKPNEKAKTGAENKSHKVSEAPKSEAKTPVNPKANYHLVAKDETLYSIARMYHTTPEKLSELNNIKNNKIVVGKKLKLR